MIWLSFSSSSDTTWKHWGDGKLSVSTLDNNMSKTAVNGHEMIDIGEIMRVNSP